MEREKNTIIVFSGDLDRAMAAFIIASGAAAMGSEVCMFFTFWGLNILRKPQGAKVKKGFWEALFGRLMPRGPEKLGLSRLNFAGLGARMMKMIMKKKNVQNLTSLIETAQALGVRMIACTMSMDVMGIRKEELIEGLEYAGVATYLGEASGASVNLFI